MMEYCSPVKARQEGVLVKLEASSRQAQDLVDFTDRLVFGHRLRHYRTEAGLTLAELGAQVDRQPSYLSMLENGHRDPNLGLVQELAAALEVEVADLLASEPPNHRAHLEIELERAQRDPLYRELQLPHVKASARVPDQMLEHLVGLYGELKRRSLIRAATPEEARLANARLRAEMRERDNHFPEIEDLARRVLDAVGYSGQGAVSPRLLTDMAGHLGFTVHPVQNLPSSARSITDLRHRRIYIPQRDELRTRAARSAVLQTLGHFALEHRDPAGFGDFLRQRVEANYFAGAVLVPEGAAVPFLEEAKARRDLSVEDLKELFYVSYEMAAHRFTNLATRHLGIPVHFIRSDAQGVIWKAYENDGVPFPTDPHGAIEGQRLCREWGTRRVFGSEDQFSVHYQYTDTPAGTYWCATHVEADREPHHAVTVGAPFAHARFFRGSDTDRRAISRCPDPACCRRPPADLAGRWEGYAWPSPRTHSHVLAALPAGTFPGVDLTEVYEFLERMSRGRPPEI
jgi:XRE family transcriptional regulator, fatty acid utilization regulator